jgi:hypothetical protein
MKKTIVASIVSSLVTLIVAVAGTAWAQGVSPSIPTIFPRISLSSRGAKLCPGLSTDPCFVSDASNVTTTGGVAANSITITSGNGIAASSSNQIQFTPWTSNVVKFNTTGAKPTCDSTKRNGVYFVQGGAGVKDTFEVCAKDATDAYAWRVLY